MVVFRTNKKNVFQFVSLCLKESNIVGHLLSSSLKVVKSICTVWSGTADIYMDADLWIAHSARYFGFYFISGTAMGELPTVSSNLTLFQGPKEGK